MRITFIYDQPERSTIIGAHLFRRGHQVRYINDRVKIGSPDILVLDHPSLFLAHRRLFSLDRDLGISISPFIEREAQYRGPDYVVIPRDPEYGKYRPHIDSRDILVDIGDDQILKRVLDIITEKGYSAVVKHRDKVDWLCGYKNVGFFEESSLYDALRDCIIGVMDGGMDFYAALYFGLPVVALARNKGAERGIRYLHHCCLPAENKSEDIANKIDWLLDSEYYRESVSRIAQFYIDGRGASRIAALIEDITSDRNH